MTTTKVSQELQLAVVRIEMRVAPRERVDVRENLLRVVESRFSDPETIRRFAMALATDGPSGPQVMERTVPPEERYVFQWAAEELAGRNRGRPGGTPTPLHIGRAGTLIGRALAAEIGFRFPAGPSLRTGTVIAPTGEVWTRRFEYSNPLEIIAIVSAAGIVLEGIRQSLKNWCSIDLDIKLKREETRRELERAREKFGTVETDTTVDVGLPAHSGPLEIASATAEELEDDDQERWLSHS
jgi:hypothetical protein